MFVDSTFQSQTFGSRPNNALPYHWKSLLNAISAALHPHKPAVKQTQHTVNRGRPLLPPVPRAGRHLHSSSGMSIQRLLEAIPASSSRAASIDLAAVATIDPAAAGGATQEVQREEEGDMSIQRSPSSSLCTSCAASPTAAISV